MDNIKIKKVYFILILSFILTLFKLYAFCDLKMNDNLTNKLKEMDNKEEINITIFMKDQFDFEKIKGKLLNKTKSEKRSIILHSLKDFNEKNQVNILKFINNGIKKGNVNEFKKYLIINGFSIKTNKDTILKISIREDVKYIMYLIYPVKADEKQNLKGVKSLKTNNNSDKVYDTLYDKNFNYNVEWNIRKVGAPQAWNIGYDGTGVTVAVLDSGVSFEHQDLKDQFMATDVDDPEMYKYWYDPYNLTTFPNDNNGHGTHVCGLVCGLFYDGTYIGVAKGAKWIAGKVFQSTLFYDDWSMLLDTLDWVINPDGDINTIDDIPDIINISWGTTKLDTDLHGCIIAMVNLEIFVVCAAGNKDIGVNNIIYPAQYKQSFAVSSIDYCNELSCFSLKGFVNVNKIKPNCVAPGSYENCPSGDSMGKIPYYVDKPHKYNYDKSSTTGIKSSWNNGNYKYLNGTSMSAPQIAGVAAILLSFDPSLKVNQIQEILQNSAKDLGIEGPDKEYGYGLVIASKSIKYALANWEENGYDTGLPDSNLSASFFDENKTIKLEWTGSDDSAVKDYIIQYKINSGDWKNWKKDDCISKPRINKLEPITLFPWREFAKNGDTIYFRSIARDVYLREEEFP